MDQRNLVPAEQVTPDAGRPSPPRVADALYERMGFTNLERAGEPERAMLYYEREL